MSWINTSLSFARGPVSILASVPVSILTARQIGRARNRHTTLTSNPRVCGTSSGRFWKTSKASACGRRSLQYNYPRLSGRGTRAALIANHVQVEQSLLFHYLSDLEAYRSSNAALDDSTLRHLDLLLDFIKKTYESTTERLTALLEKREITFDLLWAFFKPSTVVYTTCVGTGKPRCVRYDFGEEKKQMAGLDYFHIGCHYLDFDGKVFGEVSTALGIEKFRGTRQISSLGVFPLSYHQKEEETRAYLDKCGRKFLSLTSVHHCQYQGMAFYMKKNHPVKLFVNSRIMVDAAYFREANPNYARASIEESDSESSSLPGWTILGSDDDSEESPDAVKSNGMEPLDVKGDDILICSPTVLGFSLGNKLWGESPHLSWKEVRSLA